MQLFRKPSIRKQIFAALVAVSALTALVIGVVLYLISRNTIEEEYRTAHANSLQVADNILTLNMNSIIDEERALLNDSAFTDALKDVRYGQTTFTAKDNRLLTDQLSNVLFARSEIREILAVNICGNIIFTTQNDYNQRFVIPYFNGQQSILSQEWIKACDTAKGREVFYSSNILFDDGKDEVFSVAKKLISPKKHNTIGYVVFNVRKSSLSAAFGSEDEGYDTSDYMILDEGGEDNSDGVVYSFRNIDESVKKSIFQQFHMKSETDSDTKDFVFTEYDNMTTGWKIINVISKGELAQKSRYIAYVAVATMLLLIALSTGISNLIARRITKPLNQLELTIGDVAGGNYSVNAEFDNSEVGRIGNQFKDLVNNNLDLRNRLLSSELRERESELLLLQTQINPHYLYNTLDTLYFMAVIKNEDEIADFVQALSENFKLSLNQGDKLIPVSRELERIRAYMKIQNYRFENRYTLNIDVPEEMMREYMLTFLLQPLIENSVYHGMEPKPGPGTITISAQRQGNVMIFIVEDDGIGIKDMRALESGYGIRNIRERIHLFYGDEYGVTFVNRVKGGTRVEMNIPVLDEARIQGVLYSAKRKMS